MGPINPAAAFQGIGEAVMRGQDIKAQRTAFTEDRAIAREDARQRQQQGEYALAEMGRNDLLARNTQGSKEDMMLEQLQTQTTALRDQGNKLLKQESFQAMDNYFDGVFGADRKGLVANDMPNNGIAEATNSLNQFLKANRENPQVRAMFTQPGSGSPIRIDPLNQANEGQAVSYLESLLAESDPEMLKTMDEMDGQLDGKYDMDAVRARFVSVTYENGDVLVKDMVALADASGYTRWASSRTNEEMNKTRVLSARAGVDTAMVRNGRAYARSDRANGGTMTDEEGIRRFAEGSLGGTTTGKSGIAQDAIDEWDQNSYSDLSVEEIRNTPDAARIVRRVEQAYPLSTADRKELKDLGGMIQLADTASGLTEADIGAMDATWDTFKSYISDETTNAGAKSAYNDLLNRFRNELFGATLTPGETESFEKANASEMRGAGNVFSGLANIAGQLRVRLQNLVDNNEPIVIQAKTGRTVEQLNQVIDTLNKKVVQYDKAAQGKGPAKKVTTKGQSGRNNTQTQQHTNQSIHKGLFKRGNP